MLVLIAAMLAIVGAMGAMLWQRRGPRRVHQVRRLPQGVLWRWLLCESAVLLVVGCLIGAVFGFYGQLLGSHVLASVTGFPVLFGIEALVALSELRAGQRRRGSDASPAGLSRSACPTQDNQPGLLIAPVRHSDERFEPGAALGSPAVGAAAVPRARARLGAPGRRPRGRGMARPRRGIPDAAIRQDALSALDRKRGQTDGAALFSILPRARDASLLRLLVAYQIIWDFLDSVHEHGRPRARPTAASCTSR